MRGNSKLVTTWQCDCEIIMECLKKLENLASGLGQSRYRTRSQVWRVDNFNSITDPSVMAELDVPLV